MARGHDGGHPFSRVPRLHVGQVSWLATLIRIPFPASCASGCPLHVMRGGARCSLIAYSGGTAPESHRTSLDDDHRHRPHG